MNGFLFRGLAHLFLLVAVVTVCHARVYTSRVAGDDVPGFLEQLGGRTAYRAPVRINGQEARLQVIGFADPAGARTAEIRSALKLPRSNADALYTVKGRDRVTRLLLLRPGGGQQALAVVIEQSASAFQHGRQAAAPARALPLPAYPGSKPGLQVENADTGLAFATFSSPTAAPEQVLAFYHAALAADGWDPVFPDADPSAARLYLRRQKLCFVLATASPDGTHISLLHKTLRKE